MTPQPLVAKLYAEVSAIAASPKIQEVFEKEGADLAKMSSAEFAARVGEKVFGKGNVITDGEPTMGGEDFSYMLQARPGAYVFLGQGGGPTACFLHNPDYDFNDDVIPLGASFLSALVEESLPLA